MADLIAQPDNLRRASIQEMFSRIAPRYDLMNRLMTLGQDQCWRREVIRLVALPRRGRLLDLGAGTGDLTCEAVRQYPDCLPVAADFTLEMMQVGRTRLTSTLPATDFPWSAVDAHDLPFPAATFDAVVSGFLLRNVNRLERTLREQFRVLKPGGIFVALDTTPPAFSPLTPLIRIHLHFIIPTLGRWLTGQAAAYHYLPDSTEAFLSPEQLSVCLLQAGFQEVCFQRRMFGTIAIYRGRKPDG